MMMLSRHACALADNRNIVLDVPLNVFPICYVVTCITMYIYIYLGYVRIVLL